MNTRLRQIKDAGWFYHPPAQRKNKEPIAVPPASQIPGLSDVSTEPELEPKRTVFREDDSDYVRLAKQGGRQDLLQNNYAERGRSKQPVTYPRVDWYYLEDNNAQDTAVKTPDKSYQFLLPEYMVHEEFLATGDSDAANFRPKRTPYGYDRTQVYERDNDPTKKDVKLPEVKPSGYGVRAEKLKKKPVPHNQPPPPKPIKPEESSVKAMWGKNMQSGDHNSRGGEAFATEYQMGFTKPPPKAGRRATPKQKPERDSLSPEQPETGIDGRPAPKTAALAVKKDTSEGKEMFKMSRFKNVPARTESHRNTAVPAGT